MLFFIRRVVVLPFICYELLNNNGVEPGYWHIFAWVIPTFMILMCWMDYLNGVISIILLGTLLNLCGKTYANDIPLGYAAGIVFFIIHFLIQTKCFILCNHSKDLYNLGLMIFLMIIARSLVFDDRPWVTWMFGIYYTL